MPRTTSTAQVTVSTPSTASRRTSTAQITLAAVSQSRTTSSTLVTVAPAGGGGGPSTRRTSTRAIKVSLSRASDTETVTVVGTSVVGGYWQRTGAATWVPLRVWQRTGAATWADLSGGGSGSSVPQPAGPGGTWVLKFEDTFSTPAATATGLDPAKWTSLDYAMNNVNGSDANVRVADGFLTMTLSSATQGAYITSNQFSTRGQGYLFDVGHVLEFRVKFPGNGTSLYNWSAVWASNISETDVGEILGSQLAFNTHEVDANGNRTQSGPFTFSGYNGDRFVVLTARRRQGATDFYLDGALIRSVPTTDAGDDGQSVLLNVGKNGNALDVYGSAGAMVVDYVRAWAPV